MAQGQEAGDAVDQLIALVDNPKKAEAVTVFLYSSHGGVEEHQKWRRVKMSPDFATEYRHGLVAALAGRLDKDKLRRYSFDGMIEGGLGYWKKQDAEKAAPWPYKIPNKDWPHIFDGDQKFFKKVDLVVSILTFKDGKTVTCYRRQSAKTLVRKSKREALFDPANHIFRPVEGVIFQFDQRSDFLEWDGWILIASQSVFESQTHILTATTSKAKAALQVLKNVDDFEIAEFEKFHDAAINRTRSARKLATAEHNDILKDVSSERIQKCIEDVANLGIHIKYTKIGKTLRVELDPSDGKQVDNIVKVLVDYFTRGLSSQKIYATDVKHPVE